MLKTITGLNIGLKSLPAYRLNRGGLVEEELPVVVTREQTTFIIEPDGEEREIKEQAITPAGKRRLIEEIFNTVNTEGVMAVWVPAAVNAQYLSFRKCGRRLYYLLLIDTPEGAVGEIKAAIENETTRRVEEIHRNMSEGTAAARGVSRPSFSAEARQLLRMLAEAAAGDVYLQRMLEEFLS